MVNFFLAYVDESMVLAKELQSSFASGVMMSTVNDCLGKASLDITVQSVEAQADMVTKADLSVFQGAAQRQNCMQQHWERLN